MYKLTLIFLAVLTILSLLAILGLAQDDSVSYNVNDSKSTAQRISNDPDTLSIKIAPIQKNETWLERNEGTILGSFLAAIIAVFSILITNHVNKRAEKRSQDRRQKEKKNIYCGILHAIYSEIQSHKNTIEQIEKEIGEVVRIFNVRNELFSDTIPESIAIENLNYLKNEFLKYDNYNPKIIAFLTHYLSLSAKINVNLKFDKIPTESFFENKNEYKEAVNGYFKTLADWINRISKGAKFLDDLVKREIKDCPENFLDSLISMNKPSNRS